MAVSAIYEEVWLTHGEACGAADQRQEKTGVVKTRVPINTLAVCPVHPHLFATGGGDAIGALTRPSPQAVSSEQALYCGMYTPLWRHVGLCCVKAQSCFGAQCPPVAHMCSTSYNRPQEETG